MASNTPTVLVTGCAGLLGWTLCERLAGDTRVAGAYHDMLPPPSIAEAYKLDIEDEAAVSTLMETVCPDVVIHCAGLINVDAAEEDFAAARNVNALGTWHLAKHAPADAKFVYISSDAVFDGKRGFYTEEDPPSPLNVYAKTKLEGEWFVRQERDDHVIVRTNFFGRHHNAKSSFVEWIVGSLASGTSIRMATDWYFTPAYVEDLAGAIRDLVATEASGTYHVAGGERCSKYEFGVEAARVFGFDETLVMPTTFEQLNLKAPRSQDMSLDCSKVAALLGRPMPSYKDGLRRLRQAWDVE